MVEETPQEPPATETPKPAEEPAPTPVPETPAEPAAPAPKRRGRPPGSKNKPKPPKTVPAEEVPAPAPEPPQPAAAPAATSPAPAPAPAPATAPAPPPGSRSRRQRASSRAITACENDPRPGEGPPLHEAAGPLHGAADEKHARALMRSAPVTWSKRKKMEDALDEGPLAEELQELPEAQHALDALQEGDDPLQFLEAHRARRDACEERFWAQLQNPGCERCEAIVRELKELRDAEGAAIFARRYMGWEISNDPEWLVEEVERLRSTMPLSKAVRTATGKYL